MIDRNFVLLAPLSLALSLGACGWFGGSSKSDDSTNVYCPTPLTVQDAQRLTHFKDGAGRDPRDIAYEAAMIASGTTCELNRNQLNVNLVMRRLGSTEKRAIALEERGAEGHGHATISAQVHTVSISKQGEVRLLRVDVAHEEGFGLVNPLSVRKQLEGQITWFYNDTMHQQCNVVDGRIAENNFDRFPLSRLKEDPPEINITFFKTGHWLNGMGHDRCTSVQSGIADAIFQITGKRYRDLPFRNHDLTWS